MLRRGNEPPLTRFPLRRNNMANGESMFLFAVHPEFVRFFCPMQWSSAVGAGDAAAHPLAKFFGAKLVRFGQIWLELGEICVNLR